MTPCKYCHDFCGGNCPTAKKSWQKELLFASLYGAGPKPQSDLYATFTEKYLQMPAPKIPKDPSKPLVIPAELKNLPKSEPCPECGNFTWAQGWHHTECKYHDPECCPVKAHVNKGECAPPLKEGEFKGPHLHFEVKDEVADWKVVGYMPNGDALIADKAALQWQETTGKALMKQWKSKDPMQEPKDIKTYQPQIGNYAAHHGVSRYAAWEATLGKVAKAYGWTWENPYSPKGGIPSMSGTYANPHWPNLLHNFNPCTCALCHAQAKKAGVQLKKNPLSETVSEGLKKLAKSVLATEYAQGGYVTQPAPQSIKTQSASWQGILKICDAFCDSGGLDAHEWAQKTLTPHDLYVLTGKSHPQYSQDYLCQEAAVILEDFMDTDEDDDEAWAKKLFKKNHEQVIASGSIVADSLKITKANTLPTYKEGITYHFYMAPDGTVKQAKPASEPNYSNADASATAKLYADKLYAESQKTDPWPVKPAKGLNDVQHALKPGDQVIITVNEEGVLVVPEGMSAMVVRK